MEVMRQAKRKLMNTLKQVRAGIVSQLQYLKKGLFFLYLPIGLLFLIVVVLSRVIEGVSLAFLLRDVTVTGKLPFFAGFVSQLGAILWSAALTICLFALVVLYSRTGNFAASKRFLLQGSVLTGILLLDDIFLFHEEIAPNYLHIDELIVFGVYAIVGIGFVLSNRREILSSEYALLILALVMFAASITLDSVPLESFELRFFWEQLELLLEDGFKFAGIATWLMYFVRYAIQRMNGIQQISDTASP
jgi:hypothetical protein